MKRTLYILAIFAVLSGCSNQAAETPPAEQSVAPVEAPADAAKETPEPAILGIANKSEADVGVALGQPIETEAGEWTLLPSEEKTPMVRNVYAQEAGDVGVLFIEGKAVRIEFYPKSTFKYPDDAIKAMRAAGLTVEDGAEPESEAPHFLDFGGIDGMYAVRVVKDLEGNPENIGYVKIVTEERYK